MHYGRLSFFFANNINRMACFAVDVVDSCCCLHKIKGFLKDFIRFDKSAINPTLVDGKGKRLNYLVMPFTEKKLKIYTNLIE